MPSAAFLEIQPSLTAQVFESLRSDIIACRIAPNARLRLDELRERFGVAASPVREALMRLEAEGWATLEQNRGFRAAPVSKPHLFDLAATRIEIEEVALKWAIERAGVQWEAEVLAAFHRLAREPKYGDGAGAEVSEVWKRAHRSFHRALVSGCASPTLCAIHTTLFDQGERYVALSIMHKASPRNDVDEHRAIMEAAIARDATRTVHLNRKHVEKTAEKVSQAISASEEWRERP